MIKNYKNLLHYAKFFAEKAKKRNKFAQIIHKFWGRQKQTRPHSWGLRARLYRIGPLPLCLRASSCTWQQPTTVLYQNSALMVEKPRASRWKTYSGWHRVMVFIVLPRMMSSVVKQRVMRAWIVRELAHWQRAMTSAEKRIALRHQKRGFKRFLFISKEYRNQGMSQNSSLFT